MATCMGTVTIKHNTNNILEWSTPFIGLLVAFIHDFSLYFTHISTIHPHTLFLSLSPARDHSPVLFRLHRIRNIKFFCLSFSFSFWFLFYLNWCYWTHSRNSCGCCCCQVCVCQKGKNRLLKMLAIDAHFYFFIFFFQCFGCTNIFSFLFLHFVFILTVVWLGFDSAISRAFSLNSVKIEECVRPKRHHGWT